MSNVPMIMNQMMEVPNIRVQFTNILGKGTDKFISALISLIDADQTLVKTFEENPESVLQVALKAANYNLPIGNELGFAYIVPYRVNGRMTAQFMIGYKGIIQLAKRSGNIERIGATDVREGEIEQIDRLYGVHRFNWIQNDEIRKKTPIIGYVAALKESNGFERMEYMSFTEMVEFEKTIRRGNYQSSSWKNYFHSMAKKTVLRKLLKTYVQLDINEKEILEPVEGENEANMPEEVDEETGEMKINE